MKINNIKKSELELLSYTEIAKMYLSETNKPINTADLFKKICELLETSDYEDANQIADFFQSLTTSKDFILLEDGTWDLKSKHTVKVSIDDVYDDNTQEQDLEEKEENEENLDDEIALEETEDIDNINDDDSFMDDDADDELSDLTIINDDELEE